MSPFSQMPLETAAWLSDWANLFLLGSLVFGVIATFVVVQTGNVKERHWDKDRQQASERIALATKLGNEATERTEELRAKNLALEAQIQPRRLTDQQANQMLPLIAPFAGTTVKVVSASQDVEAAVLGAQIIQVLQAAKLNVQDARMTQQSFGAIILGIWIYGTNPLATELVKAFRPHLSVNLGPPASGGAAVVTQQGNPQQPDVTIFVGTKPLL